MFENFLSKFEIIEVFLLGGFVFWVYFISVYLFEHFFERNIDKRLKLLERIIFDKSKVIIPGSFDNLEGYFKFNPDGTVSKVSDLDIDCSAVDIDKPTE